MALRKEDLYEDYDKGNQAMKRSRITIDVSPELQGLRQWVLFTRDAHGLYEKTGFVRAENAERLMVKRNPDVYKK